MYQVVRILELSVQSVSWPNFTTMWQYNLDLWPPTLINNKHLTLIKVINCTKLYDPGSYGSVCISPTMFSYLDLDLWPCLKINQSSHHADQMYHSERSWSTRPGQTDGRRYSIIRPVKAGRIKKRNNPQCTGFVNYLYRGIQVVNSHNQQSVNIFYSLSLMFGLHSYKLTIKMARIYSRPLTNQGKRVLRYLQTIFQRNVLINALSFL